MKIAFLNLYSGINYRGAESFTHELANKLAEQHQVIFFQAGKKLNEQNFQVEIINCKVQPPQEIFPQNIFKKIQKYLFFDPANRSVLGFSLSLLPWLLREKIDVVFPLNGFWQLVILKILQAFKKYKIIVIGHAGPGWDERWNLYLHPNIFIALTQPARLWAKKSCSWTRIVLIPLAVKTSVFKKAEPIQLKLQKPVILCPSALVPYKRPELAIRAVAELNCASLLILGKGVLEKQLREFGNNLLRKRFRLLGVERNRMPSYYKSADIVTLPSSPQENSPMVFLESLAAGKIVTTTDTARNRWILGETAIFCDPTNINEYAQALSKAIDKDKNSKQQQLIANRLKYFSWSSVYRKYLKIINQL